MLAANSVRNGKGNQIVENDLYWGKGKEWDSINIELKKLSIDAPSRHYPRRDRRRSSDSSVSSSSSSSSAKASSRLNRLSHRPATIIEEPTLELDQVEWWGSSDIVGKSPFDHIPDDWSDRKRKSKVLFLTDFHDYLERMNTNTYEIIDAAIRHPQIDIDIWGPYWSGWDPTVPVSENVRRRSWKMIESDEWVKGRQTRKWDWGEISKRRKIREELDEELVEVVDDQVIMQQEEEEEIQQQGIIFSRESDSWSDPLFNSLWNHTRSLYSTEEVDDSQFPMWVPPHVFDTERDTNTLRGSEFEDAVDNDEMKDQWLDEVGEGCPEQPFDAVWTFSDIFKQDDPILDVMGCGSIFIQQLGDCHSLNCLKEWYPRTNNITVTKYAFEMLDIFSWDRVHQMFPNFEMGLFGHSMDSANEWDFWPLKWEDRKFDARVFGFDGSFYPLRSTVNRAIEAGRSDVVGRFDHPGYFLWAPKAYYTNPLQTYQQGHPVYAKHEDTRAAFAQGMRESRICVFDASLERKMIRKYAQAMLSGCVIAGDLPTEHEEALSKFVIHLSPSWDIDQIEAVIKESLAQPEMLKQKAMLAFAFARKYLTNTNKITDMMRLVDKHRNGARGYDLPHGFSLRCRAYWSDQDSYRPPWCQGLRGLEA